MKMMKVMSVLACCAGLSLAAVGCHKDEKKASAGAVSDKACCTDKSSTDCKDKAATTTTTTKGNMGTVSDKKSGCCSGESKTN
jgi:hypothetical protein